MVSRFIRRLPGGKSILVVALAAGLAVGGFAFSSANAPSASAQCFGCWNGFNNGFYNGFNNGFWGGWNGFNNGYWGGYNGLYGYNGLGYGWNGLYGNNYGLSYPYSNYQYVYPTVNTYAAPVTTAATTVAYTAPVTTTTVATPNYSVGGNYCNLKAGGQVWVPSGASPAAYGC